MIAIAAPWLFWIVGTALIGWLIFKIAEKL
jgi:hypothetical protein